MCRSLYIFRTGNFDVVSTKIQKDDYKQTTNFRIETPSKKAIWKKRKRTLDFFNDNQTKSSPRRLSLRSNLLETPLYKIRYEGVKHIKSSFLTSKFPYTRQRKVNKKMTPYYVHRI